MTAPEKGEQDPQACLVKKVAGGPLLPWKLMQALAQACALGKADICSEENIPASATYSRGKSRGKMAHGGNRQGSSTSNQCANSSGVPLPCWQIYVTQISNCTFRMKANRHKKQE